MGALVVVLLLAVLLCPSPDKALSTGSSVVARGLLKAADPAWLGGDGAFSIGFGKGKRLWLFGDSWIRTPRGGTSMISNAVGVQIGRCTEPLRMFWGKEEGRARAFFQSQKPGQWLWPAGGILLGDSLYLFYLSVRRQRGGGRWDFFIESNVLIEVVNPHDSPDQWRWKTRYLPWKRGDPLMGYALFTDGTHLWAAGTRPRGSQRALIWARIRPSHLKGAQLTRWQYLKGVSPLEFSRNPQEAMEFLLGTGSEFSLGQNPTGEGWLLVYTPGGIQSEIHLRTAPGPFGPWSRPLSMYRCPEGDPSGPFFCYGGKFHPHCTPIEGETLLITYSVNTRLGTPPSRGFVPSPRWVEIRSSFQGR
jgi:hypothetical protein